MAVDEETARNRRLVAMAKRRREASIQGRLAVEAGKLLRRSSPGALLYPYYVSFVASLTHICFLSVMSTRLLQIHS